MFAILVVGVGSGIVIVLLMLVLFVLRDVLKELGRIR